MHFGLANSCGASRFSWYWVSRSQLIVVPVLRFFSRKTIAAVDYVTKIQYPVPWVFWIRAGSRDEISRSLKALRKAARADDYISDAQDKDYSPSSMKAWDRHIFKRPTLMVFDDVNDLTLSWVSRLIPKCRYVSTLVITRSQQIATTFAEQANILEFPAMSQPEYLELFRRQMKTPASRNGEGPYSDEKFAMLGSMLKGNASALMEATISMKQYSLTPEEYMELLREASDPPSPMKGRGGCFPAGRSAKSSSSQGGPSRSPTPRRRIQADTKSQERQES